MALDYVGCIAISVLLCNWRQRLTKTQPRPKRKKIRMICFRRNAVLPFYHHKVVAILLNVMYLVHSKRVFWHWRVFQFYMEKKPTIFVICKTKYHVFRLMRAQAKYLFVLSRLDRNWLVCFLSARYGIKIKINLLSRRFWAGFYFCFVFFVCILYCTPYVFSYVCFYAQVDG